MTTSWFEQQRKVRQPPPSFAFENGSVRLSNRRVLLPARDAVDRWVVQSPGYYRALGEDFQILYELNGVKFALVEYRCCHLSDGVWVGDTSPRALLISARDAYEWLLDNGLGIPDSLASFADADSVLSTEDRPAPTTPRNVEPDDAPSRVEGGGSGRCSEPPPAVPLVGDEVEEAGSEQRNARDNAMLGIGLQAACRVPAGCGDDGPI